MMQERRLSYWIVAAVPSCALPAPVNFDSGNIDRLKTRTGGAEVAAVDRRGCTERDTGQSMAEQ